MDTIKRIWNSFKTGIVTWVFAYMAMYIIALNINAMDEYKMQVLKLADGMNLFYQILISGIAYVLLEVCVIGFMNRIIKSVDTKSVSRTVVNMILTLLLFVGLGALLRFSEVEKIIGTSVLTFMLCFTILKGIAYVISQQINTYIYNKKLNEKLNEESN